MAQEKKSVKDLLALDHSELGKMLDELFAAFEIGDVGRIYKHLDLFWARLAMHVRAEHLHLFPAVLGSVKANLQSREKNVPPFETVEKVIENLKEDHNFFMRELSAAVKKMRELSEGGEPEAEKSEKLKDTREKIIAVKNRLDAHNEIEETEIYLWADSLLPTAKRIALNEKMRKELENLPPRFE